MLGPNKTNVIDNSSVICIYINKYVNNQSPFFSVRSLNNLIEHLYTLRENNKRDKLLKSFENHNVT